MIVHKIAINRNKLIINQVIVFVGSNIQKFDISSLNNGKYLYYNLTLDSLVAYNMVDNNNWRCLVEVDFRDFPTRQTISDMSKKYPDLDVDASEGILLFMRTASDVFSLVNNNFSNYGLSQGKVIILINLLRNAGNGIIPSELADQAGVTRGTITGLLDGLERDGLVERQKHPMDRRMITIHLTDKGNNLLNEVLPIHFKLIARLMGNLSSSDRKDLMQLVKKIGHNVNTITGY